MKYNKNSKYNKPSPSVTPQKSATTGLRDLKPGESFSYNRKTGEQAFSQAQPGDPNGSPIAKYVKTTVGGKDFATPQEAEKELAKINLLKSGNVKELARLQGEDTRNKYIQEQLDKGRSVSDIANDFVTGNLPTDQPQQQAQGLPMSSADMSQFTTNPFNNQPIQPGTEGEQPEQPYQNALDLISGSQYGTAPGQQGIGMNPVGLIVPPLLNIKSPGAYFEGISRIAKLITTDVAYVTGFGSQDPMSLINTNSAWKYSSEMVNQDIKLIAQGDTSTSPEEVRRNIKIAKNELKQMEGYVHNEGKWDLRYWKNQGRTVELQLKTFQQDADQWEAKLQLAEIKGQRKQDVIDAQYEATKQDAINKKYGLQ